MQQFNTKQWTKWKPQENEQQQKQQQETNKGQETKNT